MLFIVLSPQCWWRRIGLVPALLLLRQIPHRSSWVQHTGGADMRNLLENWHPRGAWPSLPPWLDGHRVLVHVLQYCTCQGFQRLPWPFGCTHPAAEQRIHRRWCLLFFPFRRSVPAVPSIVCAWQHNGVLGLIQNCVYLLSYFLLFHNSL